MTKVFVPLDSAAVALGADAVASQVQALAKRRGDDDLELVRNGSRSLVWLEPLLEVETLKVESATVL